MHGNDVWAELHVFSHADRCHEPTLTSTAALMRVAATTAAAATESLVAACEDRWPFTFYGHCMCGRNVSWCAVLCSSNHGYVYVR